LPIYGAKEKNHYTSLIRYINVGPPEISYFFQVMNVLELELVVEKACAVPESRIPRVHVLNQLTSQTGAAKLPAMP
jgi:hypothetical protein